MRRDRIDIFKFSPRKSREAEYCWKGVILISNKISIKVFGDFQTINLRLKYLDILNPKRAISRNREHGHEKFRERGHGDYFLWL